MSNLVGFTPERALSANITASAGARARFFQTGTTTPVVVWDVGGNILAQPVLANAAGVFPQVTYTGTVAVKAVVTAADESALYTLDPCPLAPIGGSGASQITFTPATGISATNVQAAIEEVQGNITANTANITTLVQTGGSANAYTLTAAQTITAYAAGQMFLIRANHDNTGAATLNVDGLGARDLQKYSGGSLVALASGDLRVGDTVPVVYDGTRFVVVFAYSGLIQSALATAIATRGPIPTLSAAPGQWTNLFANVNVALSLPAGGTWAFKVTIYNAVGEYAGQTTGVAAGGTALVGGTNQIKDGFAWRIA